VDDLKEAEGGEAIALRLPDERGGIGNEVFAVFGEGLAGQRDLAVGSSEVNGVIGGGVDGLSAFALIDDDAAISDGLVKRDWSRVKKGR